MTIDRSPRRRVVAILIYVFLAAAFAGVAFDSIQHFLSGAE